MQFAAFFVGQLVAHLPGAPGGGDDFIVLLVLRFGGGFFHLSGGEMRRRVD